MAKIVSRGDPIEPVYLNNLEVAVRGRGVVFGLAVSERGSGANMSVDVSSGDAWINGTKVTKGSTTNVAITAAHASYDRYDLVVINSSGTISVIDGTAAATSYANDYDLGTNNAILLAEVYVPATDTTIEDAQITDKRVLFDLLDPVILPPCIEEYTNHLGATDNFTETATLGNGTATADTTNHEMDLKSGVTVVGYALFKSKKSFTMNSKPFVLNFLIQNINVGVGAYRRIHIGLNKQLTEYGTTNAIEFLYESGVGWLAYNVTGGSSTTTNISNLANGDILTIVATLSKVNYYVNGVLVASHTTNISSDILYLGANVRSWTSAATTSIDLSIDMMNFKQYF